MSAQPLLPFDESAQDTTKFPSSPSDSLGISQLPGKDILGDSSWRSKLSGANERPKSEKSCVHLVFVDVLNPRLQKFGTLAFRMSVVVVLLALTFIGSVIYYQRMLSFTITSAMVSTSAAEAIGRNSSDEKLCETYTTQDTVVQEFLRRVDFGLDGAPTLFVNGLFGKFPPQALETSADYGIALPPTRRFGSIWAPMMQDWPRVELVKQQSCSGNCDALGTLTFGQCWKLAVKERAQAFNFDTASNSCCVHTRCAKDTMRPSDSITDDTYLVHDVPEVYLTSSQDLEDYRALFRPMLAYGAAIGLKPPVDADQFNLSAPLHTIGFSAEFVTFATTLHSRVTGAKNDFAFPCVLNSTGCLNYGCFGPKPVCDTSSMVECAHGPGILAMKKVNKKSWSDALFASLGASHYLEILASALVVLTAFRGCVGREEREAMNIGGLELAAIAMEWSGSRDGRAGATAKDVDVLATQLEAMSSRAAEAEEQLRATNARLAKVEEQLLPQTRGDNEQQSV